jgi:hypothetical protein
MILVDYSAICHAAFFANRSSLDEDLLRHMILNTLRMYNVKFRKDYGEMILCIDSSSWRKDVFPYYKMKRKAKKESSSTDWERYYEIVNALRDDIAQNFPYRVIWSRGAEADDVIATLVFHCIEKNANADFGQSPEGIMIISADHDFIQLQKYAGVKQFSPMTKKFVTDKNPQMYLLEHIISGCSGDGVPNILSDDDVFVTEGKRQIPVRAPVKAALIQAIQDQDIRETERLLGGSLEKFIRNSTCINLERIPVKIRDAVLEEYSKQTEEEIKKRSAKTMNYLITKRCTNLIEYINDFL